MLNNGKRCKKNCVGLQYVNDLITNKPKPIFIVHCKQHRNMCEKKYLNYKEICNKVYTKKLRKKFLNHSLCNKSNYKTINKHIDACVKGRLEYPINCTNGCIVNPANLAALHHAIKSQNKHFNEITQLLKNKINCNTFND